MPRQATAGRIEVSQTIDCSLIPNNPPAALFQKTATISPGVNTVRLKKVPPASATQASVQLFVPDEPNDEDTYTIVDEDGTVSVAAVVFVQIPVGSTTTIGASAAVSGPFGGFVIDIPSSQTTITYDADTNNWDVTQSPSPNLIFLGFTGTGQGVSLDNQNAPAAVPIFGFLFQPGAGGRWRLTFALQATASAGDTLQLDIDSTQGVTAFTGGTAFGGTPPSLQPEGRYAGGGALTVTAPNPVTTLYTVKKTFQTDDDANQNVEFSGAFELLALPPTQNTLLFVKLTGASNYSAMSLITDVELVGAF